MDAQKEDDDEFNEGFILPPLIVQLRKILEQYPDDSQILKELIQNAEDAGAREVKFLLDHNSFGRNQRKLYHPELAAFQGPALYAYNDGLFDDDDWKGIRMLSQSVKQNDPLKVGYFGMGFKSVFHITDLPSLFSGERVGMIDPHQRYFSGSSTHSWNVAKKGDLLDTLTDQFEPFLNVFDCDRSAFELGFYNGTLFRFPLRLTASPLSSNHYSTDRVKDLFNSFQEDAHVILLFLRSLESVELYERRQSSSDAELLCKVQIADDCFNDVRQKRMDFLNQARMGRWLDRPLISTYPVTLETVTYTNKQETTNTYRWLVTNYYCGGQMSASFRNLHQDPELRFPPWVGTAMPLDPPKIQDGGDVYKLTEEDGHVFSFLPLPLEQKTPTGLPVHVNGFFALEQNRKYIKWGSGYRSREDMFDKRLMWNQCLLKEALPKAYAHMLLHAIAHYDSSKDNTLGLTLQTIYRAFPDFSKVDRKWEVMLPIMFSELFKHAVVYTVASGGMWIEPRHAIFNTLTDEEPARDVIMRAMTESQSKVVTVPEHVMYAIKSCCRINMATVTAPVVSDAFKNIQFNSSFTAEEKILMLNYLLKNNRYDILDGLELLPLASGIFNTFYRNPKRADRPIYISSEETPSTLLPGLENDMMDPAIDPAVTKRLLEAARRGYTQLKLLEIDTVSELLPRCFPADWKDQHCVLCKQEVTEHPPREWLQKLWLYLQQKAPTDLSRFENQPIIPGDISEDGSSQHLFSLCATTPVVVAKLEGTMLPPKLRGVLDDLGVSVVSDLPQYVKSHPMILDHYIYSPSCVGVLTCMLKMGHAVLIQKLKSSMSPSENKRCLRELFAKLSPHELDATAVDFLRKLPLFETLNKSGGKESHFVCVAEVPQASPAEHLPVPLTRCFLDLSCPAATALAANLDIKCPSMCELLKDVVFPDIEAALYDRDEVEAVMLHVLRHFHSYVEEDPSFVSILTNLPFIPRKDLFLTANRFYDPAHELLRKLFLREENFPFGAYAEPSVIAILREIGLRGVNDVEPEDLEESAYVTQDLSEDSEVPRESVHAKSNALMHYFQKHDGILNVDCQGQPLYQSLMDIRWVQCMVDKPNTYPQSLAWFTGGNGFAKPSEVTGKSYINIVGSVMPVAAATVPDSISQLFGWKNAPSSQTVVRHLANAVQAYNGSQKAKYIEIVQDIYERLSQESPSNLLELLQNEQLSEWVWNGEGFCSPAHIVFQQPFMDLRPFLYSLPSDMKPFDVLFGSCAVKQQCHMPDVLHTIKEKYDLTTTDVHKSSSQQHRHSATTTDTHKSSTQQHRHSALEVKRDLHICISILNEMKCHVTSDNLETLQQELVLPILTTNTHIIKMVPLGECTYCDNQWLRQGHDIGDIGDFYEDEDHLQFVHPNLPISTSEALGVPTLMSRVLDAEELDFSFGQSDSLTHRLNVLLQEYTDGFAVPKELVQNADDAGATQLKILYDERQNSDARTCLIDDGMRGCQGPALWAYNDATFTDDDFENITKLNGATKEDELEKIGRFGLGFNAVYNLTDVPSFVSRHNVVIFDPHTTHLGKNIKNKSRPGIKIDIKKHKKRMKRLGNQFKPYYDVFGCDLRPDSHQDSYGATLFRFPLRTREQAIRSEICSKHYDDREVKELLQLLVKGGESLLLFTQNVMDIQVFHLPRNAASPKEAREIFSVYKRSVRILRELCPLPEVSGPAKKLTADIHSFVQQSSILKAATCTKKKIRESKKFQNIDFPKSTIILNVKRTVTKEGRVLLGKPTEQTIKTWLISSVMGQRDSLTMSLQEDNLLPTAGVAVQLEPTNERGWYIPKPILKPDTQEPYGSVFTYLPLPIHTGLPVHINASFALTSNRRYLCEHNEDDKFDIRAIWNQKILEDAVCESYITMLEDITRLSDPDTYDYHMLWPTPSHVETNCTTFLSSFYHSIATNANSKEIFASSLGKWCSAEDVLFLDPELQNSPVGPAAMSIFTECKAGSDTSVTNVPQKIHEGFKVANKVDFLQDKSFGMHRFFSDLFIPNIENISQQYRDQLILFALKQENGDLDKVLLQAKCIPVTPTGKELCEPTRLIHPTSSIASLYSQADGRFPYDQYASKDVLRLLSKLGMAQDDISFEDIAERAESVSSTDVKIARQRISALLALLERKLEQVDKSGNVLEYQKKIMNISFLPVMKRPQFFPLQWDGDSYSDYALLSPDAIYPTEKWRIVGCVSPIADDTLFPKNCAKVKDFLQFSSSNPEIDVVLEQLKVLTDSSVATHLKDKMVSNEIQKSCFQIYSYLQQKSCQDESVATMLEEELKDKAFILCHDTFLRVRNLAFAFEQNCAPYLYSVPDYFKRNLSEFLRNVGVKERFETSDFVSALEHMHQIHRNLQLDRDSLKLALQLVNLLNSSMTDLNQSLSDIIESQGAIYIPDYHGILRLASELCYNEPECQWVPAMEHTNFSHPHIPFAISKQLGVNTTRQEVLKKHSKGIPFGQREKLTNRIKRILSSYPCDKEIFKEMLQNADDAGATEIHFVKDSRHHKTEKVFDESWKILQGPALCVYNNTPFTEADLVGIQKLGEGSKCTDPNKTGQYGVGFNCVYHLTDVPSFLTSLAGASQTLCVFDPHGKYVPEASCEEPGRRYDNVSELRNIFTDVFPCYLEEKFRGKGTVFRFPLRNEKMAKTSELSTKPITLDDVDLLFSKFKPEMFECLLFVNNVNSITLTEIDKIRNKLTNTYTVTASISEFDAEERTEFSSYMKSQTEKVKNELLNAWEIPPKEVTYMLTLSDNTGYYEKWLVTQRIGIEKESEIPMNVKEAFKRKDLALLPRGGVAALLETSDMNHSQKSKRVFCFLPLPLKMELPVHINGHFALDHEARRNIWVDEDGGPKTLWNNLIMEDVIGPAYVTLLKHAPAQLGSSLIRSNLSILETDGERVVRTYSDLFPEMKSTYCYQKLLVKSVYRNIHERNELILPVLRQPGASFLLSKSDLCDGESVIYGEIEWLSTGGVGGNKPYFDNLEDDFQDEEDFNVSMSMRRKRLTSTPKKKSRKEILRQVLLSSGFKLVALPTNIYNAFLAAGVSVESISTISVVSFYKEYASDESCCCLGTLPVAIENTPFKDERTLRTVLEYCLQDDDIFFSNIDGLPLLLCEDGQLRVFSVEDPIYLTKHHDLLPECSQVFLHHSLVRSVFENVDPDECPVIIRFDVHAFASMLVNTLPQEFRGTDQHIKWKSDTDELTPTVPTPDWMGQVWTFLREEYERILEQQTERIEEKQLAKAVLSPLREWCLLPASIYTKSQNVAAKFYYGSGQVDSGDQYLVPIGIGETILDFTQAEVMSFGLRDCFRQLKIPELCRKLVEGGNINTIGKSGMNNASNGTLARLIVSTSDRPETILRALRYSFKHGYLIDGMHNDYANLILRYFSECANLWKSNEEAKYLFRCLPIFPGVCGKPIDLGENTAYVVPAEFPNADTSSWDAHNGKAFLRCCPGMTPLYDALGCKMLSMTEVYSKIVFKSFSSCQVENQKIHLDFIRNTLLHQLKGEERDALLEALRDLEFLEGKDGKRHKASEFYDPYHPVYKLMFGTESYGDLFPPQPFGEFKWLEFMRAIGLQHTVSAEQFLTFAEKVQEEGRACPSEGTFNKARTLITHLFQRRNVATETLLEDVRDIQFVPSAKVNGMLRKIFPAFEAKDDTHSPYISFKEGVPECHEVLVWTSGHLLPDWANPLKLTLNEINVDYSSEDLLGNFETYKKTLAAILGVKEGPCAKDVVQHTQNICCEMFTKLNANDEVKAFMKLDVMKQVYKFLQENAKEDEVIQELSDVNCIVVDVGYSFVKPKQVVINLYEEDQIVPYLYKAPIELGEFKDLFLSLGATLNPTVDQYALVLECIYRETGGDKLHPNEMRITFRAVHALFTTLQKHPKEEVTCDILYLPSAGGCMIRSSELIFNNDPTYTDRIRHFPRPFLFDLAECKLHAINYEDMVRLLPERIQPVMLTTLVHEVLGERCLQTVVSYGVSEKLRHHLNSRAFSLGIVRLIRHEHHRSGLKGQVDPRVLSRIQDQLKAIRVYGVEKVVTYLTYNGQVIPESTTESECFVDKSYSEEENISVWNIYIDNSVSMNEELLVCVAEVVNRIVGGMLKNSVHYLQPLLSCAPHTIYRVLDRLKIRPDHSVDFKQPTLPTPGSFIPIEDHHLLRQDFEQFEVGEYVALELEDDETGGQTFVYAIIVEKVSTENNMGYLTKFRVTVGDDRKPSLAISTDLYKFHRVEGFVSRNASYAEPQSPSPKPPPTPRTPTTPSMKDLFAEYKIDSSSGTDEDEDRDVFTGGKGKPNLGHTTRNHQNGNSNHMTNGFNGQSHGQDNEDINNGFDGTDGYDEQPGGYARFAKMAAEDEKRKQEKAKEESEREAEIDEQQAEPEPAAVPPNIPEAEEGKSLEDLCEEISDALEEACKLPDQQKKKVIKRILLKWHPDKNYGFEALATQVMQHIQSELERIESGMPRPGHFDFSFDPRNPFSGNDGFQKNFYNAYQFFFDQMNQRAKEHKEQREKYKEHFSQEYSSTKEGYNFDVPPSFSSSNPQPAQARRFMRQAQEDLRAADNDYDAREPAFEWVCFKAHQASEKALKAAQFSVDAVTSFNHDLSMLAAHIEDMELRRLALKLQGIVGDSNRLYNPDPIDFVVIPHEEFNKDTACDAVMCATDILERAKEFLDCQ